VHAVELLTRALNDKVLLSPQCNNRSGDSFVMAGRQRSQRAGGLVAVAEGRGTAPLAAAASSDAHYFLLKTSCEKLRIKGDLNAN
jgi:hypothetical protein